MPIDPSDLAKSISGRPHWTQNGGLAPTLQQVADPAKQLFAADGAGCCWSTRGLSVPVELDSGVIDTLDIYATQPRDWDPDGVAALQAYAGPVASLLLVAVARRSRGGWPTQLARWITAGRYRAGQRRRQGRERRAARRPGRVRAAAGRPGPRRVGWRMKPTRFAKVGTGQTLYCLPVPAAPST
jgi:hypothetical protein